MLRTKQQRDLYSLEEAFAVLKTLQVKVTEASGLLMNIETKHSRKRRWSVREERIDPEELVCTRTPNKHSKSVVKFISLYKSS